MVSIEVGAYAAVNGLLIKAVGCEVMLLVLLALDVLVFSATTIAMHNAGTAMSVFAKVGMRCNQPIKPSLKCFS